MKRISLIQTYKQRRHIFLKLFNLEINFENSNTQSDNDTRRNKNNKLDQIQFKQLSVLSTSYNNNIKTTTSKHSFKMKDYMKRLIISNDEKFIHTDR
jgi:hypothetical protein